MLRALAPAPLKWLVREVRNRRDFGDASYTDVFRTVYQRKLWFSDESNSGLGSTVAFTSTFRAALESFLAEVGARSLVDLPCGDFNWMRLVQFPVGMAYLGIDLLPELIETNRSMHRRPGVDFATGDVLAEVPRGDVVLCRDLLIHFPNAAVEQALANIRASGSRYLLATTFPRVKRNWDTRFPDSRRHNLALHLGEPGALLPDFGAGITDKFVGVWSLHR